MSRKIGLLKLFAVLFFLFGVSFFIPHTVHADTFNVSNATQLQSALDTADSNNQDNMINLAAGTYSGIFTSDNRSGHALTLNGHSQNDTFLTHTGTLDAIMSMDTNGALTVENLTFKDGEDIGLQTQGSSGTNTNSFNLTVHNVSFIDNGQQGMYVGFFDGDQGGSVTVTDSTFDGNQGGFWNDDGNSAVLFTFSRNTFINNTAQALHVHKVADGSNMEFDRNYFAHNSAAWGAGLAALADCLCKITATSNVIVNNTGTGATAGIGAVLESQTSDGGGASLINFINNTVANNSESDTNAGGLLSTLDTPNAVFNFYNNIFWNNTIAGGGDNGGNDVYLHTTSFGSINFLNNDVHSFLSDDPVTMSNNIDANPLFQSGSGVFAFQTVAHGSPVVGAGTNSAPGLPSVDFTGSPVHNPPDLGAFTLNIFSPSANFSNPSYSTPACPLAPTDSPDLFQINTAKHAATLFFAPVGNASNYQVSYGFDSNANQFSVLTNQGSSPGVLSYTINALPNASMMYFKVYGQNNCGQGNWSNTMSVKVAANRVYYKNFVSR